VLDVPGGFPQVQRQDRRPHGDPLVELAQLGKAELFLQLLLSEQDDLEELALLRLQVREEPNLLQERRGEVLRLVDDQDRAPSDFRLGEKVESKEPVQRVQQVLRVRRAGPPKSSRTVRSNSFSVSKVFTTRRSRPLRQPPQQRGRRWSCRPRCRPSPR
jgi:hypothetical protein